MSPTATRLYVAASAASLAAALLVLARRRPTSTLLDARYWRWLGAPWKLATFAVAAATITAMAPYTGDRNWDHPVSLLMSALTFATAPFAVGALWRRRELYVAACAWMLSASWSFDWYWLARRGWYPESWAENLAASSVLYLLAGVLWNLEWSRERGVGFAFREADWPVARAAPPFRRLALPALLLMAVTGAVLFWAFFAM